MAKRTYLAILDGKIIGKRTTDAAIYTHAIIGRRDIEAARQFAYEYSGSKTDASNFRHLMAYLDGTSEFLAPRQWESAEQHAERAAAEIARAERVLKGARTFEAYVDVLRESRIEGFEGSVANGGFAMQALQWSKSAGNARKAAASWAKNFIDVRVIPATEK
jgi:hypothetical protein